MNIVITGVSQGLGLSMTKGFIEAGHQVFGCSRNRSQVTRLNEKLGSTGRFATVDVTRHQDVITWANAILSHIKAPDLLINNAGIINKNAPLWEVPQEEFDSIIDVNIKGVASVVRAFVPSMIEQNAGTIVNFSSGWGRSTSSEVAPYCATKWAIEGLTLALSQELPNGMAAVPLNPGIINTKMLQSCFQGSASSYPSADEWAQHAVPYILSLGPKDNGQSLSVPS
jgi:NAD(P)-dependent dehydrogenase (short-subunit alcohol dehydrogenase family)